ncbi:MAG: hypothetical protein WCU88_11880 [Elusimicrobiota bacterium]|jgi:hypothetical protein
MSSGLILDFHGVRGSLSCDDPSVLEELRKDFEWFISKDFRHPGLDPGSRLSLDPGFRRDDGSIGLRRNDEGGGDSSLEFSVELHLEEPPASLKPKGRALLRRPLFSAYEQGCVREVDYEGKALAALDFRSERGTIYCAEPALLRELGYLLVLSRAGHRLDLRGLHRVHALGIERGGKGVLVLLPSGGGKSALCLRLLASGAARLLSEDTPLVSRNGTLHPFPLRIGTRPDEDLSHVPAQHVRSFVRRVHGEKKLVDLDFFRGQLAQGPLRSCLVVDARRCGLARSEYSFACPLRSAFALAAPLLAGWGTPQLLEYALRTDIRGMAGLAFVGASRAAAMVSLCVRSRSAVLRMSEDPQESSEALCRLIDSV